MSQGNYAEEFKEHILSEHEAGVSVRELARRLRIPIKMNSCSKSSISTKNTPIPTI